MNQVICQCGCKTKTTMVRCVEVRRQWQAEIDGTQFRRAGRAAWIVLKIHRADFENELQMMHALEEITRANIGRSWFRRLAVSAQVYDLQSDIFRRTKGEKEAAAIAWRSVCLFLAPAWPWLIKRLTASTKKLSDTPHEDSVS